MERREKEELIKAIKDDLRRPMRIHTSGLHFQERGMDFTERKSQWSFDSEPYGSLRQVGIAARPLSRGVTL